MRLWPRRSAGTEAAPAGAGPTPVRREPPGWAEVPALGATVAPLEVTMAREAFEAGLSSHRDPAITTAPLGHELSAAGPPGLVDGLLTPTAGPISSSANDVDLAVRHRQVPVQRWVDRRPRNDEARAPDAPLARSQGDRQPVSEERVSGASEPSLADVPLRALPTVASPSSLSPLTRTDARAVPRPVMRLPIAAIPAGPPPAPAVVDGAASEDQDPPSKGLLSDQPPGGHHGPSASPGPDPMTPREGPAAASEAPLLAQRATPAGGPGGSTSTTPAVPAAPDTRPAPLRRPGLGAPIPARPVAQRLPAPGSTPEAAPSTPATAPTPPASMDAPHAGPERDLSPASPVPVIREVLADREPQMTLGQEPAPSDPVTSGPGAAVSPVGPVAPTTAGSRGAGTSPVAIPIGSHATTSLQRLTPAPTPDQPLTLHRPSAPVLARRPLTASLIPLAGDRPRVGGTTPSPDVPGTVSPHTARGDEHFETPVSGAWAPPAWSHHPHPAAAPPAVSAQRLPAMPPPSSTPAAHRKGDDAQPPVALGELQEPQSAPVAALETGTPVQTRRSEEGAGEATALPGMTPTPATAGPGRAAGARPAPTPAELDELARRLADRQRYLLRGELLRERERAGLLVDV